MLACAIAATIWFTGQTDSQDVEALDQVVRAWCDRVSAKDAAGVASLFSVGQDEVIAQINFENANLARTRATVLSREYVKVDPQWAEGVWVIQKENEFRLDSSAWDTQFLNPQGNRVELIFMVRIRFSLTNGTWKMVVLADPLSVPGDDGMWSALNREINTPPHAGVAENLKQLSPSVQASIAFSLYQALWNPNIHENIKLNYRNTFDRIIKTSREGKELDAALRLQLSMESSQRIPVIELAKKQLVDMKWEPTQRMTLNFLAVAGLRSKRPKDTLFAVTELERRGFANSIESKFQGSLSKARAYLLDGEILSALKEAETASRIATELKSSAASAFAYAALAQCYALSGQYLKAKQSVDNASRLSIETKNSIVIGQISVQTSLISAQLGQETLTVYSALQGRNVANQLPVSFRNMLDFGESIAKARVFAGYNLSSAYGSKPLNLPPMPSFEEFMFMRQFWWEEGLLAATSSWQQVPVFHARLKRNDFISFEEIVGSSGFERAAKSGKVEDLDDLIWDEFDVALPALHSLGELLLKNDIAGAKTADQQLTQLIDDFENFEIRTASNFYRAKLWMSYDPNISLKAIQSCLEDPLYPLQHLEVLALGLSIPGISKQNFERWEPQALAIYESLLALTGDRASVAVLSDIAGAFTGLAAQRSSRIGDAKSVWRYMELGKARSMLFSRAENSLERSLTSQEKDHRSFLERRIGIAEAEVNRMLEQGMSGPQLGEKFANLFTIRAEKNLFEQAVNYPNYLDKTPKQLPQVGLRDFCELVASSSPKAAVLQLSLSPGAITTVFTKVSDPENAKTFARNITFSNLLSWIGKSFAMASTPPNGKLKTARSRTNQASSSVDATDALKNLAAAILPDISDLEGIDHLIIIPEGMLYLVPFEILPAQNRHLSELFPISFAPSGSLLSAILKRPVPTSENPLVVGGLNYASGVTPLDYSRIEAERVAKLLQTNPVTESNATRQDILSKMSSSGTMLFATHGELNQPWQYSRIYLSGQENSQSYLDVNDLLQMTIKANLVVLSSCGSGAGMLFDGEAPQSLGTAFLSAGAQSVVMTSWLVDDTVGADLVTSFFTELFGSTNRSKSKLQALWTAQQKIKQPGASPSAPYFWAPFRLYGDWRK